MKAPASPDTVRNNEARQRFEIEIDGLQSFVQYIRRDPKLYLIHTEVPPELEGHGVGNALARAALDFAAREELRVVPRCSFISQFIKRHPEYQRLVDGDEEDA